MKVSLQYGSQLFSLAPSCFYNIVTEYPVLINGNYGNFHTSGNICTDVQVIANGSITSNVGGYASIGNNAVTLGNGSTGMIVASNTFGWTINSVQYLALASNALQPGLDNTLRLGDATERWSVVYAATGTINTSDANEKQQIAELTVAEKAVGKALKGLMRTFKFNDSVAEKGDKARIHVGVVAQDVQAAFVAQGLNPDNYGVFCSDTWYEVDGKAHDINFVSYTKDTPNAVEKTRLGVRYDELFAFIIAGL